MLVAFLGRCPMGLQSPEFWGLHWKLGFTFTVSWHGLSWPPCTYSIPASHCLTIAAVWKQETRCCEPLNFASFVLAKPVSHGWHCQISLPVPDGACSPWPTDLCAFQAHSSITLPWVTVFKQGTPSDVFSGQALFSNKLYFHKLKPVMGKDLFSGSLSYWAFLKTYILFLICF